MTRPRMSERRTTIIGALLTAIGPISMAIYTPAMPELAHAFHTTDSAIKLSLSLYFGGFAVAQLLAGAMSDAFGRRKATLAFLMVYFAGSLLAAFAPTIDVLLAGRLVQGIGASVGVTVARAVVRDQFVGNEASRIMNMIGIMLAIGPAAGPTLGGLALAAFGWQALFFFMVGFGLITATAVGLFMQETTVPDRSRARPRRLASAYGALLSDARFVCASLVLAGTVGALYAQATMLPFILINKAGLTPTQFGASMVLQSGSYFVGSVCLRLVAARLGGKRSMILGLCFSFAGGAMIAVSTLLLPPSLLSIMLPVGVCTFGIAFISPYIITAGLAPFPTIAGSASALMGFIQMGAGFLGGVAAAAIGDPLLAFGTVIPVMELVAVLAYFAFMRANRKIA
ncbi:MAG: multidrug effflux MFS transporter [Allorhizobium sp.]